MINYANNLMPQDYIDLRQAVGFLDISYEQAKRGIEHSTFLVSAKEGDKTIAMARLLFDFGYTAYIADVIVLPEYQGKGIGKKMIEEIFRYVESHSTTGEMISYVLLAAEGKETFYEKFGFTTRPSGNMGAGMSKRVN
jgi:GNAT superfamily N-acetyltransferase